MSKEIAGTPGRSGGNKMLAIFATLVGAALQITNGFFTVTAIGLISVPVWAIVVLVSIWLAAAVLFVRTVRRAPLVGVLVPVVNALLLWGVVAAGGAWLGWTA